MAQGVSGYIELSDGSYGTVVRVNYSETYTVSTNKSVVSITSIQVKATNYYGFTHYLDGTIKINGTTAITLSSYHGTHPVTVGKQNVWYTVGGDMGSVTVTHNSDGSKSVSIAVSIGAYSGSASGKQWGVSGSKTIVLTTITAGGYIYIDNGSSFDAYEVYIDNGSSWDRYTPYIDNGSSWDECG